MEQAKIIRFLIRKTTFFRNLNFILDATDEAIEKSRKLTMTKQFLSDKKSPMSLWGKSLNLLIIRAK